MIAVRNLPKVGTSFKDIRTGKVLKVSEITDTTIFFKDEQNRLSGMSIDQFHLSSGMLKI